MSAPHAELEMVSLTTPHEPTIRGLLRRDGKVMANPPDLEHLTRVSMAMKN